MDTKDRVAIIFFDNHCFEKFKEFDEAIDNCRFLFTVDGVEVSEQEWRSRQEEARTRELAALFTARYNQNN